MSRKPPSPEDLRVLVVAPTGQDAALIDRALSAAGLTCRICRDLGDLCETLQSGVGAVLLAEEALHSKLLERFMSLLSEQATWSDIPITLLTARGAWHHAGRRITDKVPKVGNLTLLERPLHPFALVSVMRVALRSRIRQYEVRNLLERLEASQGELQDKIHDLEQFEDAVIGRELRMIELEKQIEELRARNAGAEWQ